MDEKRMAGSYEIIHALHIGECEVVVGYDPANKDGLTYMTAFFNRNVLLEEYTNIMASPNYAETMELFAARLREQARQAKLKSQKELRDVSDNRPYDKKRCEVLDGCTLADSKTDLNSRVITEVYSHIFDTGRKGNAQLFQKAFYEHDRKPTEQLLQEMLSEQDKKRKEQLSQTDPVLPDILPPEILAKVLTNPQVVQLIASLAKSM